MKQMIFFVFIIAPIYKLCECSSISVSVNVISDLQKYPNLFQNKSDISQTEDIEESPTFILDKSDKNQTEDKWCTLACNNSFIERLTEVKLFKPRFWSSFTNWCKGACETVSKSVTDAYNTVAEATKDTFDTVAEAVTNSYDTVVEAVTSFYDKVEEDLAECSTLACNNSYIEKLTEVKLPKPRFWNWCKGAYETAVKAVKHAVDEVVKFLKNFFVWLFCPDTTPDEIVYTYYGKTNIKNGKDIRYDKIDDLRKTTFDSTKDTIFTFHGFGPKSGGDVPFNTIITSNIFRNHDVNVFVVDWTAESGVWYTHYGCTIRHLPHIGKFVTDFIRDLKKKFGVKSSNLILVGHSLGAHLAGYVGRFLDGDVETLIGLDPAGPSIENSGDYTHLTKDNARFVQVMHTNIGSWKWHHYVSAMWGEGKFGFAGALGHADYYVNDGSEQPGCEGSNTCSHSRAYEYYAESLYSDRFVAQKCLDYTEYTSGKCKGPKSFMGMVHVDRKASGNYYLLTNSKPPYAKG